MRPRIKTQKHPVLVYTTSQDKEKQALAKFNRKKYLKSSDVTYIGFTFTKKSNLKDIPYKLKNLKNFYLLTYWQKICGGLPIGLELGNHISKVIK